MGFFKELKKAAVDGIKQGVREVFDVEYGLKYDTGLIDWFPNDEYNRDFEGSLDAAKFFREKLDVDAVIVKRVVTKEPVEVD
ncbi:hypothetical protein NQ028_06760 [Corynebacterium phoceense]|uniref:hypothetical protein n=1 Tax=Corynebacterium phoceense TaxID=1686286 RepID=UPI00211CDC99|nr:hypothetical protein [Corynebacterium phoceense]MCQ9340844.1 hypothetical protein [Corynebacterium phoceense]